MTRTHTHTPKRTHARTQNVPGFTSAQKGWERTAIHSAVFVASLSVIAFLYVHSLFGSSCPDPTQAD